VGLTEFLLDKYGPFMDLAELATLLRIKKATIYNQIYAGRLDVPHVKRGKRYLFPTLAVAEYLDSLVQTPRSSQAA